MSPDHYLSEAIGKGSGCARQKATYVNEVTSVSEKLERLSVDEHQHFRERYMKIKAQLEERQEAKP